MNTWSLRRPVWQPCAKHSWTTARTYAQRKQAEKNETMEPFQLPSHLLGLFTDLKPYFFRKSATATWRSFHGIKKQAHHCLPESMGLTFFAKKSKGKLWIRVGLSLAMSPMQSTSYFVHEECLPVNVTRICAPRTSMHLFLLSSSSCNRSLMFFGSCFFCRFFSLVQLNLLQSPGVPQLSWTNSRKHRTLTSLIFSAVSLISFASSGSVFAKASWFVFT